MSKLLGGGLCPPSETSPRDPGCAGEAGARSGEPGGWRKTLCPYCGVGCGLLVQVEDGAVRRVKGDPDHPASWGDVCAKAVHLPPALRTPDRLLYPQVRARRDADPARVPWELALRFVADRLREIVAAHGPDAVAFYGSGQLLTEEYYVASKLAKGFLGTNNFDTNSPARWDPTARRPPTPISTPPTASSSSAPTPPTATR